jgi:hypothetical protein
MFASYSYTEPNVAVALLWGLRRHVYLSNTYQLLDEVSTIDRRGAFEPCRRGEVPRIARNVGVVWTIRIKDEIMTASRFPLLLKALLVLAACLMVVVGTGCQTTYSSHQFGEQRLVARHSGRTLMVELPKAIRVPAVIATTDEVVRGRGYTVLRQQATEEAGSISSFPPGKSSVQRLIVRVTAGDNGTEVRVSYEPFSDRKLCESILDALLARLSAPPEAYTK